MVFYFGPGSRSVNRAGREGGIPGKLAHGDREPGLGRHLYYVRWGASGVTRTGDALNGTERWHANLDGVALGSGAEFFEQVTHGGGELRLIAGLDGFDSLLPFYGFNASLHTSKLRG
jgi:hypothetical protein